MNLLDDLLDGWSVPPRGVPPTAVLFVLPIIGAAVALGVCLAVAEQLIFRRKR